MSSTYTDSKYHAIIRTQDEKPLIAVPLRVVAQYIQRQEEHHRGMSFDDELRKLLTEHGLATQIPGREAPNQWY